MYIDSNTTITTVSNVDQIPTTEMCSLSKRILMDATIEQLGLSFRSYSILAAANIKTVWALCQLSEDDLIAVKKMGKKSLNEIKSTLHMLGLQLQDAPASSFSAKLLNHKIVTKYDWTCERLSRKSITFPFTMPLNAEETQILKLGFKPTNMEQKWFFYYESGVLNIYRSWTGRCYFRVILNETTGKHIATAYAYEKYEEENLHPKETTICELLRSFIYSEDML